MPEFSPAETVAIAKAVTEAAAKAARAELAPGVHPVDITVHISGSLSVAPDTVKTPTCSIPMLETVALLIKRMGIQREPAMLMLREVMTEALMMSSKGEGAILREVTELAEWVEEFKREVTAHLPKSPVKGAVKASLTID